jgi:hypothetical protein
MDEYEIGKVYFFEGKPYRFKGGDPANRGSWADGAGPPPRHGSQRTPALQAFVRNLTGSVPFADEIVGTVEGALRPGMSRAEGRAKQAGIDEQMRADRPKASTIGDIIGGLALPAGAMGVAAKAGKAALAGAGAGAVVGGLSGADEASGGIAERIAAALPSAGFGAVGGGVGGALAAKVAGIVPRIAGSPGSRAAKSLRKATGLSGDVNAAIDKADDVIKKVQSTVYRPFDEAGPVVDEDLLSLIRSPQFAPHAQAVNKAIGEQPPAFSELQAIRSRLRGGKFEDPDLYKQLDAAMKARLPGLHEADAAYRHASNNKRAIEQGMKFWDAPAAVVERQFKKMTTEAQEAFNTGKLFRIIDRLEANDKRAPALLRRFMDAGPSTQARMRSLFPDDKAFNEFMGILQKENSAQKLSEALKLRWWVPLAGGAAGGFGATRMLGN